MAYRAAWLAIPRVRKPESSWRRAAAGRARREPRRRPGLWGRMEEGGGREAAEGAGGLLQSPPSAPASRAAASPRPAPRSSSSSLPRRSNRRPQPRGRPGAQGAEEPAVALKADGIAVDAQLLERRREAQQLQEVAVVAQATGLASPPEAAPPGAAAAAPGTRALLAACGGSGASSAGVRFLDCSEPTARPGCARGPESPRRDPPP